jgi:hypothetical protein
MESREDEYGNRRAQQSSEYEKVRNLALDKNV